MHAPARLALDDLRPAERALVDCAASGSPAPLPAGDQAIRASVLQHVLLNCSGTPPLEDQTIEGQLILAGRTLAAPLVLRRCRLDTLNLVDARLQTVDLAGSTCRGIEATRVSVDGAMLLHERFRCDGQIRLNDASIGGDLRFDEGDFTSPDAESYAILFDGARIGGRLFLRRSRCRGRVCGRTARVEGGIVGEDAEVEYAHGAAIWLQGLRTAGRIDLAGSRLNGALRLTNARVGGQVNLDRARIGTDGDEPGLHLREASIGGSLRLNDTRIGGRRTRLEREPLAATAAAVSIEGEDSVVERGIDARSLTVGGEMRLPRARIGGNVALGDARLRTRLFMPGTDVQGEVLIEGTWFGPGAAVVLAGTTVAGRLVWKPKVTPAQVDLRAAQVGVLEDDPRRWPEGGARLAGFTYGALRSVGGVKNRASWLRAQEGNYISQPYEQMIGVLEAAGEEDVARSIGIAKERHRTAAARRRHVRWLRAVFLGAPVAYGYQPWRALVGAVAMIAIGWAVFAGSDFVAARHTDPPPQVNPLVYSIDTFLPIIELPQKAPGIPTGGDRTYLWFHIGFGWLLTTIGVIAVTSVVRRT